MNNLERKRLFLSNMAQTRATRGLKVGGGLPFLSLKALFRSLIVCITVSTTSLRSFIAMNKQYLTDRQYALLISPFDNDYLGCNGVVKAVACGYPQK